MPASESQRTLFELAQEQSGNFAAKQASKLGYTASKRNYRVRVGSWREAA
jgi:hypothetical protein